MFVLSVVTVTVIVAGYVSNHLTIFSQPISLFYGKPFWWFYNLSLFLFTGSLAVHLWDALEKQRLIDVCLVGILIAAFIALQFVNVTVQPAHDALSLSVMAAVCLYSFYLAGANHDPILAAFGILCLCLLTMMFSNDLTAMGVIENLIVLFATIVFNVDYYRKYHAVSIPWPRLAGLLLPFNSHAKIGGFIWASQSLLGLGIPGVLAHAMIGGPVIALASWFGGYLAWRDDYPFSFKGTLRLVSYLCPLLILGKCGVLNARMDAVIVAAFLFILSFASQLLYDVYGHELRA